MLALKENYEDNLDFFISQGIDVSYPGFYDDANFIKLENNNPDLLENYAKFVAYRPIDNDYLLKVDRIMKIVPGLLYEQLVSDGRMGACVDISMALSRILEREGIWNYQVKGSLTISFPTHSNIERKYFWSVHNDEYSAGHSWLVVPPYRIVDLTVQRQPYFEGEESLLPDFVLAKHSSWSELDLVDIIQPDLYATLKMLFNNRQTRIMEEIELDKKPFSSLYRPEEVQIGEINFKYSPIAVIAPDASFENSTSLRLNGLYGIDLYEQIIKPKLRS